MAGDKVHRGVVPPLIAVDVRGAGQPQGGPLGEALVPLEVAADIVPIAAIPLRPPIPGGEGAHLIQPARVPGLGDELHVAQNGVEGQGLEQGGIAHGGTVLAAAQDGGQIEAEAVDAVGGHPVAQAVQNHLPDDGVVAVHGVAAAGEVVILPVGGEQIVDVVVKALEGEEGAFFVALGGVVEHHVQIDLDAPAVASLNQPFELVALPVELGGGGVAGVGSEKADGAVAPVVVKGVSVHLPVVLHLIKLENGHQLDGVDPQLLQVVQLLHQAGKGAGVGYAGGGVLGKAPDMELVDDQVLHGNQRLGHIFPVEVVLDHPGLVVLALGGGGPPPALAGDRFGVGVQQILAPVEDQPTLGIVRAVYPVGVLKLLNVQLEHDHGVDIADAVVGGEGEDGKGLVLFPVEEEQLDGAGPVGVDGEVDAAGNGGGAVAVVEAGPDIEAGDVVQGDQMDGTRDGGLCHERFPPLKIIPIVPQKGGPVKEKRWFTGGRRSCFSTAAHIVYQHRGPLWGGQ